MRIVEILLEDRVDFLRNRYLPMIRQRYGVLDIPNDIDRQIYQFPGPAPEQKIFNWLASLDPTPNRQYLQWILACAVDRAVPFEDLIYLPDTLAKYHQRKRTNTLPAEARDINRIRTPSQLDVLLGEIRGRETAVSAKEEQQARRKSQVLLDDDQWLVLIPKTPFAAKFYGRGTQWCTAWGDPHGLHPTRSCRFYSYNRKGPLIIAINKTDPAERYQFHERTKQYMDRNNHNIKLQGLLTLLRQNPTLVGVLVPYLPIAGVAGNESQQIEAIKNDFTRVRFIEDPSEVVQLAAVEQSSRTIEHIKNPTEAVKLAAVEQDGLSLRHIEDPSKAVQMAAVEQNGLAIYYIKAPTEDMQLAAVRQNVWAIEHIKNPTEAVQLEVVRQKGRGIRYIKDPSPAAIELARKQGYDRRGDSIR